MQITERPAYTIEEYAEQVRSRGRGTFQSKETRDAVATLLHKSGFSSRKSSIRGQNLHPEYVTDYVGRLETGFGNHQYMTYWSVLYTIEGRI